MLLFRFILFWIIFQLFMLKAVKNGRFLEMMDAQNTRHFLLNNSCNQKMGSTIPSENAFYLEKV